MTRRRTLLAALLVAACGGDTPAPDTPDAEGAPPAPAGRSYERGVVFTTLGGDSTLVVPWLLEASVEPGGVERRARGWLLRAGEWEPVLDERWQTPPTDAPWRILPHGPLRLIVGTDDALERMAYAEGERRLEIGLGASLAEWSGGGSEVFQLADGTLTLGEGTTTGLVLDMARVRPTARGAAGDWLLLVSGDSLQLVLHTPLAGGGGAESSWRGWARLDFRELPLPAVTVDWAEERAFDRARRTVPVAWTIGGGDGAVAGALELRTSLLEAGEGAGPLLPVDGLFTVEGTVVVDGGEYPVRGLYRHTQGGRGVDAAAAGDPGEDPGPSGGAHAP